jgi:hypothetical protein
LPQPSRGFEDHLVALQGLAAGSVLIAALSQSSDLDQETRNRMFVLTPLVQGGLMCAIGFASKHQRATACLGGVGGAYVGALGIAASLAYKQFRDEEIRRSDSDVDLDFGRFLLVGVAVLVQPLFAVGGYHVFTQPPTPPPASTGDLALRMRSLPRLSLRGRTAVAGELVLPVTSLAF